MPRLPGLVVAAILAAAPLSAQVSVSGTRDLSFGFVTAGITATVLPTDASRSGEFRVTAPVGSQIQIRLTVPTRLNGPSGASMPTSFRNGDAFVTGTWTGALPSYFNPSGTAVFRFSNGPQAMVRLGGQVTPATNQQTGSYQNTVVCTVNFLN
jgi:hypothetical protein